jgi:type IV pilus assembly protein PilO
MTFFPEISDPYENEQGSTESSSKVESLPISLEGLRTVRLHVKIQASDYKGLARFTEEIDRLDRIMNIDSISYISPTERMRVGDTVDPLEFRVVISAFYFPELAEGLQEETPLLDYPRPSGKRSPLYNE